MSTSTTTTWLPAKSWQHLLPEGTRAHNTHSISLGGMCGAVVTSPFDVVKTRLQSDLFRQKHAGVGAVVGDSVVLVRRPGGILWHFVETAHIIRDIARDESPRAYLRVSCPLWWGSSPRAPINFFTYGNGKQIIADRFNSGQENSYVHLCAAAIAGIATGSATNPIWVIAAIAPTTSPGSLFGGSVSTIRQIAREEGVRGFYKGLSASYLGVTEGTIQRLQEWAGMLASAGTAKCVASLITYPHEVLRTRLRQPLVNGTKKEGARSLYGGLSAHLMRVVPNAAVMYSIYEGILRWGLPDDRQHYFIALRA
ncbi:mitochondrial carrier domain-containing protein [Russula vinacea]|nr:mitochondrial carrier domain-containing protein [Russula vinacea]